MDVFLRDRMCHNNQVYKRSLDRIIDKYSKLQYQEGGIEVDLNTTLPRTLGRYMKVSKTKLNELESTSLADLREESLRAQDITRDSQLDFTTEDGGADETCVSVTSSVSTAQLSVEDDGMCRSDTTQLTASSLDEGERNLSVMEIQPEDQDEELEMSLRSHGTSLVELYPSMISRIERAWHRQNVSEAANSVLRRYRKWRQQSNRSCLNNTFNATLGHASSNPRRVTGRTLLKANSHSPMERTGATPLSPVQVMANLRDRETQQRSPGKVRGVQHRPILVMDFSGPPEPQEISLNKTFTVSQLSPPEVSQLGERRSTYAVSPSRPCYPTAQASFDPSIRSRRLSLGARSPQTDVYTAVKERPDVYGSPVRQSPLKARMMASISRSPHAFSRSPKACLAERFSREPTRPRPMSSPQLKPTVPQRMFYPQDSHRSFHPQLPSPQSASASAGRHRLQRHHSFDSCLQSTHVSYSPKKLDEDLMKLYHKFVCQNKSLSSEGPPCRFCARSSKASRGQSSSALAALALSPHRSVLRKRQREFSWDSHPQAKRSRDESCTSSPGSKRHGNEMWRRRLCPSECDYSPNKRSMFHRFNTQQRSADAHQETWMSRSRCLSAAEFSGLGGSLESTMTNSYSPRKW